MLKVTQIKKDRHYFTKQNHPIQNELQQIKDTIY